MSVLIAVDQTFYKKNDFEDLFIFDSIFNIQNKAIPFSLQETKIHKEMIFKYLKFEILCVFAFVAEIYFSEMNYMSYF